MPELPDAEVFRRRMDPDALGRTIDHVRVPDGRLLADVSASTIRRRLRGQSLEATHRHGKYVFAGISGDNGWLMLHFGMTGSLEVLDDGDDEPEHTKLRLDFDDGGMLAFTNQRTFGKIGWVREVEAFVEDNELGPDALDDMELDELRERLVTRRSPIKSVLMDQSVLAGLGNVYVDEILFQTGLHPEARPQRLRDETVSRLHRSMNEVLVKAIEAGADPEAMPAHFLLPHRREGSACPKCGRRLRKQKVGGRATYYCPRDQRRKT